MTLQDIAITRLFNHQILDSRINTVKDIVEWMGAMQAQDYAMSKWAIGARLLHSTEKEIDTAIEKGEIIRTHVLRPTWHFVSPDDIYWMLELTAPRIKASMRARDRDLGLTESIFEKSNSIIESLLKGEKHLSKETIVLALNDASIETDNYKDAHILMHAELDGLICSSETSRSKRTYTLLQEIAPETKKISKEEALALLAKKYFTSHGPATLQDFVWWSGLSVGESRQALEMNQPNLCSETINNQTYWFKEIASTPEFDKDVIHVLPAFDEFLISYKDRSASLILKDFNKVISSNGIFRPFLILNGQVIGIWRRVTKKDRIIIETTPLISFKAETKKMIEEAFLNFEQFSTKKIEIIHK